MSSAVEEIKSRLSAVEVIGNYIKLEKSGTNFKGLSPFSNEKTPSFYVSEEKGLYHCFSTGKGGDIFSFIQEIEGVDFKESLKILADMANIDLSKYKNSFDQKYDNSTLYSILESSKSFFIQELNKNDDAKKYLSARGISEKTIKNWSIGFVPDKWSCLCESLKNYKEDDLIKSGMAIKGNKGKVYDRFRGRIMFPIADNYGKTVAFSGRKLKDDSETDKNGGKYINSPETILFHKSNVLFGYSNSKNSIRKLNFAILVEGQFDVLMAHQVGYTNTVATSGTAFTKEHAQVIKRLTNNLIIAYDMDKAGINASEKAWIEALSSGFDVKIAVLPEGKDPADLILESPENWKKSIKEAVHVIEFLLGNLQKDNKDSRILFKKIGDNIFKYINLIQSDLEKNYFFKKISEITELPIQAIYDSFENYQKKNNEEYFNKKGDFESDIVPNQNFIQRTSPVDILIAILEEERYNESPRFNIKALEDFLNKKVPLDLINKTKENIKKRTDISFILEIYIQDKDNLKNKIKDLLHQLNIDLLKNKRSNLKKDLENNPTDKNILSGLDRVNKEIHLAQNNGIEEIDL